MDNILYHGSPNKNLTKLDIGKSFETGDQYGRGIYLTANADEAKQYAGPDGKVYKVHLDDSISLFNLKNKLSDQIKSILKSEVSSMSKDIYNNIIAYGRKIYNVIDNNTGLQFFKDKQNEWSDKDNRFFANRPVVKKQDGKLTVVYSDFDDINNAIENMTGENLYDVFSGDVSPDVFAELIISSGYDGIITHNDLWYVIYTHIDNVHILNENIITEGMHLVAYVRSPYDNDVKTIEDSDYASKKAFSDDLRANGYTVLSVNDNRDLYVADNSDYGKVTQLKKQMDFYKKMWDDTKRVNPDSTLFKDDYDKLKKIYDEAMRQPLTESNEITNNFTYLDDTDKPKYNDYVGLSMQIDGTKNTIKQLKTRLNKAKYDADKNKYKYQIEYYNNLLLQYEKAKKSINNLKENKIISLKDKLEEVSRNELLAKAKLQTITRYEKSSGYKGFNLVDVDTTSVFTRDVLRVTCRVGNYWDTIELDNILYWVQLEAEKNPTYQINTKGVTAAIMNAADGMDIKVDCTCADFKYRFAYMATKLGYKYGKPENRPANITNPNDYGSMCKHLISMLSNKKWLRQVTSVFMDFLEDRIDDVNRFLRPKEGEELTLPNELARQNAKKGFYSKLFKDVDDEVDNDSSKEDNNDTEKSTTDSENNITNDNENNNDSNNS